MADTPPQITDLAAACVTYVHTSLGLPLDHTQDTLPILDHYVRSLEHASPSVVELTAAHTGAYFGEVLRRHIPGLRWHVPDDDPAGIRLEMESCFLWFNPVGVAREVITRTPAPDWNAHLQLLDADRPLVESALQLAGQVQEDDYFSFSVRYEVAEQVINVLVGHSVTQSKQTKHAKPGPIFGPEVYSVAAGERRAQGTS